MTRAEALRARIAYLETALSSAWVKPRSVRFIRYNAEYLRSARSELRQLEALAALTGAGVPAPQVPASASSDDDNVVIMVSRNPYPHLHQGDAPVPSQATHETK